MSSSPHLRLVSELYLAASELDPETRERYLDEHCPDAAVRRHVERMLEAAPPEMLRSSLAPHSVVGQLEPGSRLGHYEIQAKLGSGGMGWVYQALDHRLNRTVAIKVLPPGMLTSDKMRNRLVREAQAASALNHPNIVTVFEVGSDVSGDFIVMERVSGQTLVQLIGGRGMELREALRLATQIADALAAAHETGIVHRDLKPGNVMVTERGLVKVLDFGLAKNTSMLPDSDPDISPTMTMATPGRIFGTVEYMSPEQAAGEEVDARSDIFAFGCVLYEMVTGQRAFQEDGKLRTLAAVVGKEPVSLTVLAPALPQAIERIIETCLRKKRVARWQHMADVKMLLEHALKDLSAQTVAPQVSPARWRKWSEISIAGFAAALLTAVAFWTIGRGPVEGARTGLFRRVTADQGLSAFPALSKDGSLLAFASDRSKEGNLDIWIQQIGGREPIRLTRDEADDSEPAISPDGTRVAFRSERAGGGVYVVPALGGEAVLAAPRGRNPRFSPDGRWIAYWEGREAAGYLPGSARVFVVEAGGGQPRQVGREMAAALYPVWSPKSDALLVLGRRDASRHLEDSLDWWILPLEGGSARGTGALAQFKSQGISGGLAWQVRTPPLEWRDGRPNSLLFAAAMGDTVNLWEIDLATNGKVRGLANRITAGPGYQMQASVAASDQRDRMAFANLEWNVDVWAVQIDSGRGVAQGEMKRVTQEESFAVAPSLSADGSTLAFLSRRSGLWSLRTKDLASGKERTVVGSASPLANSKISGDGNSVAYSDYQGNIFLVPRKGGSVEKLCERCGTTMGVSFDGKRIAYEPLRFEDLTAYDVGLRKSVVLASRQTSGSVLSGGQFSPDGHWIAFHSTTDESGISQVWIARVDASQTVPPAAWIPVTSGQSVDRDPAWAPGGGLLYFVSERDGFRCIWATELEAVTKKPVGEAFAVKHFHSARRSLKRLPNITGLIGLSVAADQLMFALGEVTGDIWLQEKQ